MVLGFFWSSVWVAQHHLDLARADAERERAEGAVGRGVRVAADDRHARAACSPSPADDVDDALVVAAHAVEGDLVLLAALGQLRDQVLRQRVEDADLRVVGRDDVVDGRDGAVGPADLEAAVPEPLERLGRGHLVDQVQVDVEDGRAVGLRDDDVLVPDLLEERLGHRGDTLSKSSHECNGKSPRQVSPEYY
jgi:hypothetical protein